MTTSWLASRILLSRFVAEFKIHSTVVQNHGALDMRFLVDVCPEFAFPLKVSHFYKFASVNYLASLDNISTDGDVWKHIGDALGPENYKVGALARLQTIRIFYSTDNTLG